MSFRRQEADINQISRTPVSLGCGVVPTKESSHLASNLVAQASSSVFLFAKALLIRRRLLLCEIIRG